MNLTNLFFNIGFGISLFFAACFVTLFISYLVILERVNKNFKAVDDDESNSNDY
ncbi:hypothetical protein [Streptococcus mutans]|uniref:Uncharacterized protein n=1 Tax=Streptococcus mutans SM6 TaxID=857119 RepID=A0A829BVY3_STRMG|nr:hypothetical protein [Streptococcus mutans]EMC24839.1 hypothetical protein SMU82_03231 [Streptococcus mutans SM6]MCB5114415.1 hypothetical protein [Streptococcus mutans]MDT9541033.1 hypothetical protein [Streptococcus mutans]MDT9560609.1 hypothetical protein [Streptococcus mutans]VTY48490.1 Uncharacterised protein [Streptococcus mutans]